MFHGDRSATSRACCLVLIASLLVLGPGAASAQGPIVIDHASLPAGVSAALQNNTRATVQVVTSDVQCFGFAATDVRKTDGLLFKAFGE